MRRYAILLLALTSCGLPKKPIAPSPLPRKLVVLPKPGAIRPSVPLVQPAQNYFLTWSNYAPFCVNTVDHRLSLNDDWSNLATITNGASNEPMLRIWLTNDQEYFRVAIVPQ